MFVGRNWSNWKNKDFQRSNATEEALPRFSCIYLLRAVFQVLNFFPTTDHILEQGIRVHGVITFQRTHFSLK